MKLNVPVHFVIFFMSFTSRSFLKPGPEMSKALYIFIILQNSKMSEL